MPEKWSGNLIGRMHNERITRKDLADEMNVSKAYVTMILNGERNPPGARERLEAAFESVKRKRKAITQSRTSF